MPVTGITPLVGVSSGVSSVAGPLAVGGVSRGALPVTALDLVSESRDWQRLVSGGALRPVSLNSGWTRESVFETIVDEFLSTMEMNGLPLPPRESIKRETVNAEFLPDSTARLELVVNLQTKFGLEDIPGEEAEKLKTVGAAADYIAAKLGVTE